jgi:hypothetical protein
VKGLFEAVVVEDDLLEILLLAALRDPLGVAELTSAARRNF